MNSTKLSANEAARKPLTERLEILERRIAAACAQANRDRAEVALLPVSKTHPAQTLQSAYSAGLRRFGENYLQEAVDKMSELPDDCEWHFIGPIQSNKTRSIAEHFDWVHSIERAKIAQRLNDQRPANLPPLNVCLQVNVSGEASKSGIEPAQLPALVKATENLDNLRVQGLMCIPEASSDQELVRAQFALLRRLRDDYLPTAPVLSMGMSSDLELAIEQGSTLIRVGSALFGPRAAPNRPA